MFSWLDTLLQILLPLALLALMLLLSKKWENERACRDADDRAAPKAEENPVDQDKSPVTAEKSPKSADKLSVIVKIMGSEKPLVIESSPSDRVIDVKLKIQELEGISVNSQRLIFCGRPLENQAVLKSCGVVDGSVMHFMSTKKSSFSGEKSQKSPDKFSVIVNILGTEKKLVIECSPLDTVIDVKLKIQELEGTPANLQRLIFCGRPLKNQAVLKSCGIVVGSVIHFVNQKKHLNVIVRNLAGSEFAIEWDENDRVEDLKKKIEIIEGTQFDSIRLICGGKQLEDGRYLQDYNIQKHTIVHLVLRLRGGFIVHIRISDGRTLQLGTFDTIRELKHMIRKKVGIPVRDQVLVFDGNVLKDDSTREDCNITDNSTVNLIIQN